MHNVEMAKRVSKMVCRRVTRKTSKLPPFEAYSCPGLTKQGKDGKYISFENSNGVFAWKKLVQLRGSRRNRK